MIPLITRRDGEAHRIEPDEERALKDTYLPVVQQLAAARVTPDDFHLRGMYLCNSARDYYYSRFTPSALDEVAEMLAGRPVMVGHDYGTLPVGRFVSGERVERRIGKTPKRDSQWVKGLFYVPRDEQGDAVVRRIDTGIYREVSIGWRCLDAACSVCKHDIRDRERCEHVPGEVYEEGGICEYQFSGITAVLEGSLVFAGGQKDTSTFVPAGESGARAKAGSPSDVLSWDRLATYCRLVDAHSFTERTQAHAHKRQRSSIVTISCSRKRFDERGEASRWVRDQDFRADRCVEGAETFDFEQRKGKRGSGIALDDGVTAYLSDSGAPKPERGMTVEQYLKGGG